LHFYCSPSIARSVDSFAVHFHSQTFLRLVERLLLGNLALLTFILSSSQFASMISSTSLLTSADVASATTVQDLDAELDTKSHSDIVHSLRTEPKLMHSTSKTRNLRR
jgi:hypothetical protein